MNGDARHERGQRAAGLHLRQLLLRPGPYRDSWERLARDARPGEIRQDAVCQVIADWLQNTGERGETDNDKSFGKIAARRHPKCLKQRR